MDERERAPRAATAARQYACEPVCPGPTSTRIWSFSMETHVPAPEPPDPAGAPTEADLAFDRLVERVGAWWRRPRPALLRRLPRRA